MSKPARPELRFATFDELLADVDRLRSGPYDKAGKWDLGMILDHLARMMNVPFTDGLRSMPWPAGAVARFVIHLMVKRNKYPSIRFHAPRAIRPSPNADVDTAYTSLKEAIDRVKAVTGETITVPPFGVMPTADFIGLQLLHAAHHLSFLKPQAYDA
jgi:hypothetical protein